MTLTVHYTQKMVADSGSFSPSAGKPKLVVEDWIARGLSVELCPVMPVSQLELSRTHDVKHVREILAGKKSNGFGNCSMEVADSLQYTSGSMLCAARYALKNSTIACSPTSGFHHAGYEHVGGFCTFNGLVVTAMALRHEGLVARVGILDLDMHYGDGTAELLAKHKATWVYHFTAGRKYREKEQAKEFFKSLPKIMKAMEDCDVILYQAGADPHVKDPLGGWLTTSQLRERDEMVFSLSKAPIAWNLAGGYQVEADGSIPKVLEIHANTAKAAIKEIR